MNINDIIPTGRLIFWSAKTLLTALDVLKLGSNCEWPEGDYTLLSPSRENGGPSNGSRIVSWKITIKRRAFFLPPIFRMSLLWQHTDETMRTLYMYEGPIFSYRDRIMILLNTVKQKDREIIMNKEPVRTVARNDVCWLYAPNNNNYNKKACLMGGFNDNRHPFGTIGILINGNVQFDEEQIKDILRRHSVFLEYEHVFDEIEILNRNTPG